MSDVVRWLEAGGLVPPDTKVPKDVPVDTVDARGYRHPALADRVVVRLIPDVISRGVDTEMGLMGFAMTDHADDIALRRRQALGFPGRALLEDPKRARYALDVMKEFKTQAKRIASKPGHARDGFDAIAKELSGAVPHFLPSYWEEVGRAFANAGNLKYAATAFDRARTAEREFGLTVDEEIRGEAFLEFALLGGLTVKSLQAYGKELLKSVGAPAAYERMFSLAVRRTLGGLPPWASMIKDLRTLAKAAKRDLKEEQRRLLGELLQSSSLVRAPKSFWKETKEALLSLCAEDPKVRGRLLDLFPNGGATRYSWREEDGFSSEWMGLLAACGALEALSDLDAPPGALPQAGRAAWFVKLQEWATKGDPWILQLLRRAAPALISDGKPVVLETSYNRPLDLDLLELTLELSVPWSFEEGGVRVDLVDWSTWENAPERFGFPEESRVKDPVLSAANPEVAKKLAHGINLAFGEDAFERIAARLTGLHALRAAWLDGRIADLTVTGLASTATAVGRLEEVTRASHFAEFPEALEGLGAADVATALHRTLTTGIIDEFGWPAFDEAMEILGLARDDDPLVNRQWPHLILANRRKAVVLGPAGVELVHDVKLGKDEDPDGAIWVDGDLFLTSANWTKSKYVIKAYWASAPKDTFTVENYSRMNAGIPIEVPGAIHWGVHTFSKGDRAAPKAGQAQYHDKERSWVVVEDEMREQDRSTGAAGEPSIPGFLADVVGRSSSMSYYVVPEPYAATSPLGTLDGLAGFKVVPPPDLEGELDLEDLEDDEDQTNTQVTLVSLAGPRFVGPMRNGTDEVFPNGLIRFPGDERYRPVGVERYRWRANHDAQFTIGDPEVPHVSFCKEGIRMCQGFVPPVLYWHYFTPRDGAGSKALRQLPLSTARALIEAAKVDGADLEARVAEHLPAVTHPLLLKGIAVCIKLAADLDTRVVVLREARAGGVVGEVPGVEVEDEMLTGPLSVLRRYWSYGGSYVTAEIRGLGRALVGGESAPISWSRLEPRHWIGHIRAFAWVLARPGLTQRERQAMHDTLGVWRDSGLADPGHYRMGSMKVETMQPWVQTEADEDGLVCPKEAFLFSGDGWRTQIFECDEDEEAPWDMEFLEWSEDGTWPEHQGAVVTASRVVEIVDDRAWLDRLLAAPESQRPRTVTPEAVEALCLGTGMSKAEGVLALSVFPDALSKEERAAHGLKVAEVKGAVSATSTWDADAKLDFLAAAAPADPAKLWSDDPADAEGGLACFIATWLDKIGRVIAVPSALLTAADRELSHGGANLVRALAAPKKWSELHNDALWEIDADGDLVVPEGNKSEAFDSDTATEVAELIPWVATRTPVGDPLRAQIPGVLALAQQRASHEGLWLEAGTWYFDSEKSKVGKAAKAWYDAVGGEEKEYRDDDGDLNKRIRVAGPVLANLGSWNLEVHVRPAGFDAETRELIQKFVQASDYPDVALEALELLKTDDFEALAKRIEKSPLPDGAWEQDARLSAPKTLSAVCKTLDLEEAPGLLYLQTLTLLDPTKKNVMLWNGWKPAAYTKAVAILEKKKLVLVAKRARAGRDNFLPGAWSEEKQILPYEEWKKALYGWDGESFPLGTPSSAAPIHVLFDRAWARYAVGDVPKFREVRR